MDGQRGLRGHATRLRDSRQASRQAGKRDAVDAPGAPVGGGLVEQGAAGRLAKGVKLLVLVVQRELGPGVRVHAV